jgi:hypothetical protein
MDIQKHWEILELGNREIVFYVTDVAICYLTSISQFPNFKIFNLLIMKT